MRLQISVWGGKRQREDGYYVAKRKMLCWATKQKVSDSLFPIQSAARRAGSRQCHGSGASLTPVVVVGATCCQPDNGWSAEGIVSCVDVGGRWRTVGRGRRALLESYIQLKPGPGFSLETCTFERRVDVAWPVLHSVRTNLGENFDC